MAEICRPDTYLEFFHIIRWSQLVPIDGLMPLFLNGIIEHGQGEMLKLFNETFGLFAGREAFKVFWKPHSDRLSFKQLFEGLSKEDSLCMVKENLQQIFRSKNFPDYRIVLEGKELMSFLSDECFQSTLASFANSVPAQLSLYEMKERESSLPCSLLIGKICFVINIFVSFTLLFSSVVQCCRNANGLLIGASAFQALEFVAQLLLLICGDPWSIPLAAVSTVVDGLLLNSINIPEAYSWIQTILPAVVAAIRFYSLGPDAVIAYGLSGMGGEPKSAGPRSMAYSLFIHCMVFIMPIAGIPCILSGLRITALVLRWTMPKEY